LEETTTRAACRGGVVVVCGGRGLYGGRGFLRYVKL